MAYGTVKDIHIKGIVRAGADTVADDGAMNEIIGLEGKNGSLIPYYPSKRIYTLHWGDGADVKMDRVLVHKTSNQINYIYIGKYHDKNAAFWASEEATKDIEDGEVSVHPVCLEDVVDVIQMGDVLCFTINGSTNKYYRFNGTTYEDYVYEFPDLPAVHFSVGLGVYDKEYMTRTGRMNMYYARQHSASYTITEAEKHDEIMEKLISSMITARGLVREGGGLTGMFLAVYAYRLKTGEYVCASNPILLNKPYANRKGRLANGVGLAENFIFTSSKHPDGVEIRDGYNNTVLTNKAYFPKDTKEEDIYLITNRMLKLPVDIDERSGFYNETAKCPSLHSMRETLDDPNEHDKSYVLYTSVCHGNNLSVLTDGTFPAVYEEQIDKLCVFISPEIDTANGEYSFNNYHDSSEASTYGDYGSYTLCIKQKTENELKEEILNIGSFYLVDEIDYADLCGQDCPISRDKNYKVNLVGKLGDNLLVRETLPTTVFRNIEHNGGNLFVMNGRLHQYGFDIREFIDETVSNFEDYPGAFQIGTPIGDDNRIVSADCQIVVNINSASRGSYRLSVYKERIPVMVGVGNVPVPMNAMISFPDSRADSMVVFLNVEGTTYRTEVLLTKFKNLNLAAGISSEFNPVQHGNFSYMQLPIDVPNEGGYYKQPNTMAVSEVNLPAYFRPINEVQFGDGEIIGLSSFAMPMSQDQYGSYTLLAFCSDGIFSANMDRTGNYAYDYVTVFPSREVCLGRDTICQIDGAIVFASNKGLVLLNHNGSSLYCEELIGDIRMLPSTDKQSPCKGNYLYGLTTNGTTVGDKSTVNIDSSISRENIIEMIGAKGTHVSYMSQRNKILISNGNYDYCYSIDIPTRVCTKYPIRIVCGDKNIPSELYYADYGDIDTVEYKFDNVDYFSGNSRVLVQSRPIKTSELLRGTYRVIANGHFCAESTNVYCEMLVLGSLDGHSWHRIGLKEKNASKPFNNLGVTCFGATWNFIMVIISGELSYGSHIDGITIQSEPKYNNKLK